MSRAIFAIKHLEFTMSVDILKKLDLALIHPQILYRILAWGNVRSSVICKTITFQKYAIRSILVAPHNSHTYPLFNDSECDILCIYIVPAKSVVSVRHSGPLWFLRQQRCLDSLVNIERQTLGAPSGPRVLLGRSW